MASQRDDYSTNRLFYLIILFAIPITLFMLYQQQDIRQRASPVTPIFLIPSSARVTTGEKFAAALQIKTDIAPVKAVQLNLQYPSEKLKDVQISYGNSPFQVMSEELTGPGIIRIGRDATVPVAGYKQIASLQFTATQDLSTEEITLGPGSYALSNENKSLPVNLIVADASYYQNNNQPSSQILERFFDFILDIRRRLPL